MNRSPLVFAGNSHPELARAVAAHLGLELGKISFEPFPDGEIGVQIGENVRGRDTFVIQSPVHHPNRFLMELFIIVDALKRASAKSIVAVLPYYAYARQDRKEKGRVPITARLVADLLERAGVTRLLTMDLHTEQIQGFFNIPVDHLYSRPLFVEALGKRELKGAVIVSPDVGGNRMARKFAEDLELEIAIVDKRRLSGRKVASNALIGNVEGKLAILVDDICSTGGTLEMAARVCKEHGAKRVIAVVAHGLFLGGRKLKGVDEIYLSDSVPQSKKEGKKASGVHVVSIAALLAKAIECVISAKSIRSLFREKI